MRANHPFTAGPAGWDLLELLARHAELEIDEHAFPLFAHSIATARRADARSIGMDWYPTENLKRVAHDIGAAFDDGAAAGDREDEKTTRAQISFQPNP